MNPATLAALNLAAAERRAIAFAKRLSDGAEFLLPDIAAPAALNAAGQMALAQNKTGTTLIGAETWFIEARNPAPRLVIVGAVHIAQALAPLGTMTGFDVILVDPRRGFATAERFAGIPIIQQWPDTALAALQLDNGTAVVVLTHDPKLDDPALGQALRSDVFYIGALGSRKSHAARLTRLREAGHDDTALQRIRGPVGLAIGAISAPEIAVSVIAEIIAVHRQGSLANPQSRAQHAPQTSPPA